MTLMVSPNNLPHPESATCHSCKKPIDDKMKRSTMREFKVPLCIDCFHSYRRNQTAYLEDPEKAAQLSKMMSQLGSKKL